MMKVMSKNNQTSPTTSKISTYLLLIVLIVIGLSIAALGLAANAYLSGEDIVAVGFLAAVGLIAMTMSAVILYQSQRRTAELKIEIPKVTTTIECQKCGSKNIREFQRGDFVFKELEACPKCPEEKQLITAIYKEVKEKEKSYGI